MDKERNWITLVDEDGNEIRFDLLHVVDIEGQSYAVLIPEELVDLEDEDGVIIMKIEEDENGEEYLTDIDDDEFDMVCEKIGEILDEEVIFN